MPSKTRGKRNPTPGVVEESIRPPMVAPTQNSETDVSVLEAEYDGVFQPQSVTDFNDHEDEQGDGGQGNGIKGPKKKTQDVKWTPTMEEKLIAVVIRERAYMRTDISKDNKFEIVKSKLLLDRDFNTLDGMAEKTGQAFKKKYEQLMTNFKRRHALDSEGANLSGLDGDRVSSMSRLDNMLYTIGLESEQLKEKQKLLTEKEKDRNRSCLTYEAMVLKKQSVVETTPTGTKPSEDIEQVESGGSADSKGYDGFLARYASSSANQELEETKLKVQEAKNKELELRLQLQNSRMQMMMMKQMKAMSSPSKKRKASEVEEPEESESEEDDNEDD